MAHKLDIDTLVTPALLRRFRAEAEYETEAMAGFWAILEKNVEGDFLTHCEGALEPDPPYQMVAMDVCSRLNREIHHDGAWVVLWIKPQPPAFALCRTTDYESMVLLWMDKDGDVQLPLHCDGTIIEVMNVGILHWVECAEKAWQHWDHMMRKVLDVREGDTFKRALGQNAPSSTLHH